MPAIRAVRNVDILDPVEETNSAPLDASIEASRAPAAPKVASDGRL
jgi:hypothetical protein